MADITDRSHPSGSRELGAIMKRHRLDPGRGYPGMTQRALADASNVHYSTIQKLETGDRGMGMETFAKLASVLGDEFVEDVLYHVSKES